MSRTTSQPQLSAGICDLLEKIRQDIIMLERDHCCGGVIQASLKLERGQNDALLDKVRQMVKEEFTPYYSTRVDYGQAAIDVTIVT